ncbi:hypothetical protein ABZ769_28165 [Streptomyces olivoreticuli]
MLADVIYVLICLAVIVTGTAAAVHLRGSHPHKPDCRPCKTLNKLFRA